MTLTATYVAILAIEPDFRAAQRVYGLVHTGHMPVAQAARLLKCPEAEVLALLACEAGSYSLKQSLLRLSRLLASDGHSAVKTVTQRPSHLSASDSRLLAHLELTVTLWPVEAAAPQTCSVDVDGLLSVTHGEADTHGEAAAPDSQTSGNVATTVAVMQTIDDSLGDLSPTLNLTDPLAPCRRESGRVRTRHDYCVTKKQPQLLWTIHQLRCQWPSTAALRVYDVCGGRGDLGLCIARSFPQSHVTVLDANALSLAAGRRRAAAVGLTNVDFACVDLASWAPGAPSSCSASSPPSHTLFIGLHACGALSDTILALAVRHHACFFVVPCCFGKHGHLPAAQHWFQHLSPSDVASTASSMCESDGAIPPPDPDWSRAVLRLAESPTRTVSVRAMHIINSLRLSWVQQVSRTRHTSDAADTDVATSSSSSLTCATPESLLAPRLLCFDETASLRNFVLVRLA